MSALNEKSVLVIDDMKVARIRMAETCRALGFKTIQEANTGKEAWAKLGADNFKPDIILTDYHMPDMDGLEFLELVRESKTLKDVPVLFVTTETEMIFIMKAVSVGVTEFVIKPYTTELLEKKIKFMLEHK